MRAGELCAGYGGLMMAIEEVLEAEPAWVSEFDPAPSKILAYHYPTVPNYGDMTKIDWAAIEPVDIISGGTPCQDLSAAGRRAGMTEGTRSNLWVQMREAIAIQKPTYVVWENVRGAYSAEADSSLEQCAGCLGDAADRGTVLRALGRVLGDLSDLGFDAEWRGLRAADVGACHSRFRVFVLARRRCVAPYSERLHSERWGIHGDLAGATGTREDDGRERQRDGDAPDHSQPIDSRERRRSTTGDWRTTVRANGNRGGSVNGGSSEAGPGEILPSMRDAAIQEALREAVGGPNPVPKPGDMRAVVREQQGSRDSLGASGQSEAVQETSLRAMLINPETARPSQGPELGERCTGEFTDPMRKLPPETPLARGSSPATGGEPMVAWGAYEPAIRRWEKVMGRPAPNPTEPTGRNGGHRLSPALTEWMMGLPDGWVTGPAIGISRNEQLKACGNGVVPQQAVAALRDMLAAFQTAEVAA